MAILNNFWLLFGSIWLTVGLPFLFVAGYFIVQERQLTTRGQVVDAMVLTKDITGSPDSDTQRSVTYRFTAEDGGVLQGRSDVSEEMWNALLERGPVAVVYLPGRPSVHHVVGAGKLTLLAIFASVGGLLLWQSGDAGGALFDPEQLRHVVRPGVPDFIRERRVAEHRVGGRGGLGRRGGRGHRPRSVCAG